MKEITPSNQQLTKLHHQTHPHIHVRYVGWDTLVLACICIFFAVYYQVDGITPVFIFSVYILIMTSLFQSNWLHQQVSCISSTLHSHPLYDLLKLCHTHLGKMIVNAAVIFIPIGLILGTSYQKILACAASYIGYGLLLTATNILAERVLGRFNRRFIIVSFYLAMIIVFLVPGVIIGYWWALTWTISDAVIVILLGTIVWNTALSLLLLVLCRNLLNRLTS